MPYAGTWVQQRQISRPRPRIAPSYGNSVGDSVLRINPRAERLGQLQNSGELALPCCYGQGCSKPKRWWAETINPFVVTGGEPFASQADPEEALI
jgi:hypothetical protein